MHALIIGQTGSGKSYLAKELARRALVRGTSVIWYDPFGTRTSLGRSTLNPASWVVRVHSARDLLHYAKAMKRCAVFVDESPVICNNLGENKPNEWLATMSRHNGHKVFFMAQKFTSITPIYRDNCTQLFLFSVSPACAKLAAGKFGKESLHKAAGLHERCYYYAQNFADDGSPFEPVYFPPLP